MDIAQLAVTAVLTVIGSGLGTTLVGAWYKRRIDRELEVQKAYLYRASRVHERQIDSLAKLYGYFTEMQTQLQLWQKSFTLTGEDTTEYPKQFRDAAVAALHEFTFARILLPTSVVEQCNKFFDAVSESHREYTFWLEPLLQDPMERMKLRNRATDLSFKFIPQLLTSIEAAMREVVHGDNPARFKKS